MRKLIIAVLVLISLDSFAQPTNYTWYKQRIRQYSLMLDSMLYIPRYNGTPSGVRANENSAIDGAIAVDTANGRQYFYYNGSWRRLANYSELGIDSIWRVAGKDSIFWSKAGSTYKIKDSIGGGGSTPTLQQVTDVGATTTNAVQVGTSLTVQGGNDPFVSIKQATTNQEYRLRVGVGTGLSSQSFSLYDATAAAARMVITTGGHMVLGRTDLPAAHSRLLVYGGLNGANIDALPDSTQNDESNMEVMGADYYGSSFQGYGVAMTYNGNANTGSLLGYSKKNFGQLRFTGVTNFVRVINNASLRFATNNTERMVLDSNGNVGIGVKVPSYKLHVEAAAGATATPFYVNDSEDNTDYSAEFAKAGVRKIGLGTEGNIDIVDISAPSTPSSGYGRMYVRADSLRFKNDAGTEFTLGVSSGGGGSGWGLTGTTVGSYGKYIGTNDDYDFKIYTNGILRVNVDSVTGSVRGPAQSYAGTQVPTFGSLGSETGVKFVDNYFGSGIIQAVIGGTDVFSIGQGFGDIRTIYTTSAGMFGFNGSTTTTAGGPDVCIKRNAAGILEINNGTAGTYRDLRLRNLGVGTSTWGTSAVNVIGIANGTVPSTSPADMVQLYAEDVSSSSELKVRDEAGNITTLSPHNFGKIPGGRSEKLAWSFYSQRNGEYITADMTKALRTIENQSSEIEELKRQVAELKGLIYEMKAPVKLIHTGKVK